MREGETIRVERQTGERKKEGNVEMYRFTLYDFSVQKIEENVNVANTTCRLVSAGDIDAS